MILDIKLTALAASTEEATLVQWLVSVGDTVSQGQVIAEVETDKAIAELESPQDGVIASIEVEAGTEEVPVGATLARLKTKSTDGASGMTPEQPRAVEAIAAQGNPQEHVDSDSQAQSALTVGERILASPRARSLAREHGQDLSSIQGSGPGGRIVARDVKLASSAGESLAGESELLPWSDMRKTIARRLTESARNIPQFSLFLDIELDKMLERRNRFNRENSDGVRASINDFIVWACAKALSETPDVNASFTEQGILRHRHANIAVAVAIEGGLVTPVIPSAESKTVTEIASETRQLVERARGKRLKRTDLEDGTFTVSNLGMAGIRSFTSILSPPQACILSVGAAQARPVIRDGEVVAATVMTAALTCDHRVVDGALGAEFLTSLGRRIESGDF